MSRVQEFKVTMLEIKMTYLEAPPINTSIKTIMAAVVEVLGANDTSQ